MNITAQDLTEAREGLAHAETEAAWLDQLEDIALETGWFEPLGREHTAIFDRGSPEGAPPATTLLVTFEQMDRIRQTQARMPLGWSLAPREGWANLCLMAHAQTWFRSPVLIEFLERLAQDGLFDGYERVLFYGAGTSGHAAAVFSSLAPGAQVVLVSPQATLTPELAGWDHRWPIARRLDFTSRFGFAPELIESAERVFVLYDPLVDEDAAHAALFHRPNVTALRLRYLDASIEEALVRTRLLPVMLRAASMRRLTALGFWRAWRIRRRYFPYLRRLLGRIDGERHPARVLWLIEAIDPRLLNPRFLKARKAAHERLAGKGPG